MGDDGRGRSKVILTLHLIFLIIYLGYQVATLVTFKASYNKVDNDILMTISWISWMVADMVNSLIMLVVVDQLNKHYQKVLQEVEDEGEELEQIHDEEKETALTNPAVNVSELKSLKAKNPAETSLLNPNDNSYTA